MRGLPVILRSGVGRALVGCACLVAGLDAAGAEPPADWLAWQARRLRSVAGTNGWTTLAGLHWLREGENSVGADPTNDLPLPQGRAPSKVGKFVRAGREVRFIGEPGAGVLVAGKPVSETNVVTDVDAQPTRFWVGSLSFWILDREERMGLRVRDPESSVRRSFPGLRYHEYDPAWKLEARYEPYREARTMSVRDVTGARQSLAAVGELVFDHAGATHRLEAVEEKGEADLFVIFRDRTAGETTYASGRFVYVPRPVVGDRTILDFNRAYNPPCAFTAFATCPIPPRKNWLPFAVEAGELSPR